MILYNITSQVSWIIHNEWKEWLQNEQLPAIMETGLFERYQLVQLLETDETEGPTYALQLYTPSMDNLRVYRDEYLVNFAQMERSLWGDNLVSFSSTMRVIN